MNPQVHQQFDPQTIEALKVARNQVVQAGPVKKSGFSNEVSKSMEENTNITNRGQGLPPKQPAHNKFAEEFVQKLTAVEQETAAIDEEIAKMEKIWLNLTEKKKQLESRRDEFVKVKDKLKELDEAMSAVLSKEL